MTVEEIVRNYWSDVWIERDLSALGDYYTDPTIRHTVNGSRTLSIDELRDHLTDGLSALRGEAFTIDALTLVEDIAWIRLTLRGISLAAMTPMTFTWIAQYRLENGKIAETWALHHANLDWHQT